MTTLPSLILLPELVVSFMFYNSVSDCKLNMPLTSFSLCIAFKKKKEIIF